MIPRVWIFSVCWNEAVMLPFYLRHYSTFAEKIIIWDEHSDDGSRELIKACPKAELRDWPWKGMDDDKFLIAYDQWPKEAMGKADWVITPDIDELIYHPSLLLVLGVSRSDVLAGKGYALIGNGPVPKGDGQIYDYIKTGYPQDNYTKWIIWRPHVFIRHTHGRHDLPMKCSGRIDAVPRCKLLHCHYFSPEYTEQRNRRNYARNVDKKFAWNYTPEWEAKKWRGTHTWHQDLVDNNKLVNII